MGEEKEKDKWDAFFHQEDEEKEDNEDEEKPRKDIKIYETTGFRFTKSEKFVIVALLVIAGTSLYIVLNGVDSFYSLIHVKQISYAYASSNYLSTDKTNYDIDDEVKLWFSYPAQGECDLYIAGPNSQFSDFATLNCSMVDGLTLDKKILGTDRGAYTVLVISDKREDFVQFLRGV